MSTKKNQNKEVTIDVMEINYGKCDFLVLGKTPIILNCLPEKVRQELLMPHGRKTSADKMHSLKHNPYEEFRNSPYYLRDEKAPTYLAYLATAFKKAIAGAAIDIPGAKKAQMGRLMWVEGERIPIYGIPKLHMTVTRSADINHTPDVRSRCIIPEWAAKLTVRFMMPVLTDRVVSTLFAAAGMIQGVGDWRPEKGSGNFGQFELVSKENADFNRIVKEGGRKIQIDGMKNPKPYDDETENLLAWFDTEADKRGIKIAS